MVEVFGKSYSKDDLRRFAGRMEQIAGVRRSVLADGPSDGIKVADVFTGSGFAFTVLLDRGMDIGAASYQGIPLAFTTPVATAHPSFFEPENLGWLRTWGGGLMTGCGLTYIGSPTVDQGEPLGLHGRVSHTPAENVSVEAAWRGDDYFLTVRGEVREAVIFGSNLLLKRRITARLGDTHFRIEDEVINEGFVPADHMMLYHCNFGFPIVTPESRLEVATTELKPRTEIAAGGIGDYDRFNAPVDGYQEQVFFHTVKGDGSGYATAAIANPALGLRGYVRYRQAELPILTEWKMMGAGSYVCGLEPGNGPIEGRDKAREAGRLRVLEPGETVSYDLEIGVEAL